MTALVRIIKIIVLNILPSFGDISTDVLNGLDFLGYNASSAIVNTVTSTATDTLGFNASIATTATDDSTYREDVIWGYLAIALVFAPGIPLAISLIIYDFKDAGAWCGAILALACYPVFMFLTQLAAFCDSDMDDGIVMAVGFEAFFESSPQMVLQLFSIQYGYPVTGLQIATIFLSFVLAAKTSITYDLKSTKTTFGDWKETARYILCVIPVYTTGIMFRIGAQSVITAYLRHWALLPIFIQTAMYAVFTVRLGFDKRDILLAIIANLGSMTRGSAVFTDAKASWKFLLTSIISTFVFESVILLSILVISNIDPTLMDHWQVSLIYFHHTNYIVGGIIVVGLLNLLLLSITHGKLQNPDGKPSEERDPDVELPLQNILEN